MNDKGAGVLALILSEEAFFTDQNRIINKTFLSLSENFCRPTSLLQTLTFPGVIFLKPQVNRKRKKEGNGKFWILFFLLDRLVLRRPRSFLRLQ